MNILLTTIGHRDILVNGNALGKGNFKNECERIKINLTKK